MNHNISPSKTALTFGILIGGLHVVWSLLVVLGLAQGLLSFIFWAHMINMPAVVMPFNVTAAVTLVVVASFIGCIFGYLLAIIWNRMHRAPSM